ncbi:hypothetical protein [Streptacidiphilus carbonis]|uniref:hypothetical protein n=1 Tax=Streptacidiphilus carbonis TaxID=105422 RepID=UPI000A481E0D|nr:hypothetical protein [Streptacidiphilus carbonis]
MTQSTVGVCNVACATWLHSIPVTDYGSAPEGEVMVGLSRAGGSTARGQLRSAPVMKPRT